jgi:hypothetical protein
MRLETTVLEQIILRCEVPDVTNLQRRLKNLTQRLTQPIPVSDAVLRRLSQKLEETLVVDLFRDTTNRIETNLKSLFGGQTGLCEFRNHFLPARHLELATGVLNLDEPYRSYGLRLLRKRWGNVHWDLENEPFNRRFLDRLAARGIQIEPWLSLRACQVTIEGQTSPWTLSFESDEVETLLMGYYFGTCLSPDDCNFFSAVVNAIDINKRVLYARDATGKVMGRALFAIGDAGTVLVFVMWRRES